MSDLNLELLGGFEVRTADGTPLSFPTKKTKALLAYLAVHPGVNHSRSDIAGLLWGCRADEQARASLRQALAGLRKGLAPTGREHLVMQGDFVSIDPAFMQVDVAVVEALVANGDPEGLARICDLYQGEFLGGLDLREEAFNAWLRLERTRLQGLVTGGLRALMAHCEANGEIDRGVRVACRLLEIDPIQEHAHRSLMRIYARDGERGLALRQYDICRETLRREVDSEPDAETTQLWNEIRATPAGPGNGQDNAPPPDPPAGTLPDAETPPPTHPGRVRPSTVLAAGAAIAIAVAAAIVAAQRVDRPTEASPGAPAAVMAVMAARDPALTGIAVLPFDYMGGGHEQDYFTDGITEDLITDLSRVSGLFVIARSTMFTYKGEDVDARQVGRELGVGYVLEGSLRQAGDRIRISARLTEVEGGHLVWTDRFDRAMADIFTMQDEITRRIVKELAVELTEDERGRIGRAARVDPEAYDMLLRGLEHYRRYTPADNAEARRLFERALALDPRFTRAYADLALTHYYDALFGVGARPDSIEWANEYVQMALNLDDTIPQLHFAASDIYRMQRRHDDAIAAAQKAIALDPNYADGYGVLAQSLLKGGEHDAGLAAIREAMRLNPRHPFPYLQIKGHLHFIKGQYEEALAEFEKVMDSNPEYLLAHLLAAATYGHLGRTEDAQWQVAEIQALSPGLTIAREREKAEYRNPADLERYLQGLRKAGMEE